MQKNTQVPESNKGLDKIEDIGIQVQISASFRLADAVRIMDTTAMSLPEILAFQRSTGIVFLEERVVNETDLRVYTGENV